jgi:threonine aldolase
MQLAQLQGLVRPENDHLVRTKLICLENTHNRGAGRIQPQAVVEAICKWAHDEHLATHLDGARLFNASVATGLSLRQLAASFDTVSVCFSKGLGAPVGSALAGPRDLIKTARRHRKLFGGAMRQGGVIAAGALYAVENHVGRLAEDHAHAQRLAVAVRSIDGLRLQPAEVDTNIVIFAVSPELGTAAQFCARLDAAGLRALAISATTIRLVTHLDVSTAQIDRACEILADTAKAPTAMPGGKGGIYGW